MLVAACVKYVDLRPQVDRLTGHVTDGGTSGWSAADLAAVETALRLGETWSAPVAVVSAAPESADAALREFRAVGVDRVVRVELGLEAGVELESSDVANVLSDTLRSLDASVVCCGDYSADRGSGSVPAYLAHGLGAAQALGAVEVHTEGPGSLRLVRRLDGGRREQLVVDAPCVISVEGSVAELRRASLGATLAARDAPIDVAPVPGLHGHASPVTRPWSPPARVQPAPAGDAALQRVVELTGALVERTPPRTVELSADDAAELILDQLRAWGYLESSAQESSEQESSE